MSSRVNVDHKGASLFTCGRGKRGRGRESVLEREKRERRHREFWRNERMRVLGERKGECVEGKEGRVGGEKKGEKREKEIGREDKGKRK